MIEFTSGHKILTSTVPSYCYELKLHSLKGKSFPTKAITRQPIADL